MPSRPALRRLLLAGCALGCAAALAGCGASSPAPVAGAAANDTDAGQPIAAPGDRGPSLLSGRVALIDGTRLPLASLRGRVVLVVNTASRCGFTPQFEGLEALYGARRSEGLVVVGFPSNDFRQELTKDGKIAAFCTLNYGVSFPMASKSHVTGRAANTLFAAIASRPAPAGEPPAWNFTKYLLDRSGRLVARYPSSVEPGDPALRATLERLLAEHREL
jgi:glutathione peroxidase